MLREQAVGVETHPGHDAGAEVLEHDVAEPRERAHDRHCFGLAEVEADVALAAVLLCEVRGHRVDARPREAGEITLGRFDFDDVGAEVDEHPSRMRAREDAGQVEHTHTVERAGCRHGDGA